MCLILMTFQQYRQKHGMKQKNNTISDGTKFEEKNAWKLKFREKKLLDTKMFENLTFWKLK